jgi:hypothetical protein
MAEIYARPLPADSTRFWVCLRNAFPEAMSDESQYERALANMWVIYAAGYETTANAISLTLAALALDAESQEGIAEVWHCHTSWCPTRGPHAAWTAACCSPACPIPVGASGTIDAADCLVRAIWKAHAGCILVQR